MICEETMSQYSRIATPMSLGLENFHPYIRKNIIYKMFSSLHHITSLTTHAYSMAMYMHKKGIKG